MANTKIAALVWATKKRHIAVDGVILCQPPKSAGYSKSNGSYNTLGLSGIPATRKIDDDVKYSHTGGLIKFKPLHEQDVMIITSSICKKCLKKYKSFF